MTTGFIAVIPARFASTRLPGKPLKDIAGKPMIEWVYRQTVKSGAREVIVATDDERIAAVCRGFGARVELTSTEHASGTDRIAELARRFEWEEQQIIVNVQGDEPLISPLCIAQTARLLGWHPASSDRNADGAARIGGRVSGPELRQGRHRQGRLGVVLQPCTDPLAARWRHARRAAAHRLIRLSSRRLESHQRRAAVRARAGREARAAAGAVAWV